MNDDDSVTEGSSADWTVLLKDEDDQPAAPDQAFVSVYCRTTGAAVRSEAPLGSVGSTLSITTSAAENVIIDRAHQVEVKRIVVRSLFGNGSGQLTTIRDYTVRKARP